MEWAKRSVYLFGADYSSLEHQQAVLAHEYLAQNTKSQHDAVLAGYPRDGGKKAVRACEHYLAKSASTG